MNPQKLPVYAAVAEIVSAAAIVISLLYVASEFRQSQTVTERDAEAQLFERVREANRQLIENPGVAALAIQAEKAPGELTEVDHLRYLAMQHQYFDSWELAWSYHADGVLGTDVWREWDAWFTGRARELPHFAWVESRKHFAGAFRDHVDRALAFGLARAPATPAASPTPPSP